MWENYQKVSDCATGIEFEETYVVIWRRERL